MKDTLTIYVLCHKNLPLARRAVSSIMKQDNSGFDFQVVLMVNTNNQHFYIEAGDAIAREFPVFVAKSASNGSVGRGKNSCVEHWHDEMTSDWMMTIDGDDWLYPHALWHLHQVLQLHPDVECVGLQTMDMVSNREAENYFQINENRWMISWGDQQPDMTQRVPRLIKMDNINKQFTVARTILNKRGSTVAVFPEYPTFCFEDMVENALNFQHMIEDGLRYVHISTSAIYIVDQTVSGQQDQFMHTIDHQTPYEYHVNPIVDQIGNLNYQEIPFVEIKNHPFVNEPTKIAFINKTFPT